MQKHQATKFTNASGYRGTVEMTIPAGGAAVRQVTFFIPQQFAARPTVTLTVYPVNGNGTMFVIYDVTVVNNGNQTEIKVTAQNTELGQQLPGLIVMLDYLVIGG
jgi:hypothetical protein